MKILVAVNEPSRHLFPLLEEWEKRGVDLTVVVDRETGRLGAAHDYRRRGMRIHSLSSAGTRHKSDSLRRGGLRRIAAGADVIVVGGYSARSARAVLLIPRDQRSPTVMLAERPDHRTLGIRRFIRDQHIRRLVRRCDAVWAMSAEGQRFYAGLGAETPILAPYPMLTRETDRTTAAASDPLRVAFVGSLDTRKNPLLAASALRLLATWGVDFRATFCGAGPLADAVRRATRDLSVEVLGQVSRARVEEVLAESDVLIHPAGFDGWGMAVVEAVAGGAAVVATSDVDSAVELARVASTVHIVPPDSHEIASAAIRAFELARSAGGAASASRALMRALHHVGLDAVASRTLDDLAQRCR